MNVRYGLAHQKGNQLVKKKNSESVVHQFECASGSPGGLVKIRIAGPAPELLIQSVSVRPENLRFRQVPVCGPHEKQGSQAAPPKGGATAPTYG